MIGCGPVVLENSFNCTRWGTRSILPQSQRKPIVVPSLRLTCTLSQFYRKIYEGGLLNHRNDFRWAEYSLSASFMHICIAMIAGIVTFRSRICHRVFP